MIRPADVILPAAVISPVELRVAPETAPVDVIPPLAVIRPDAVIWPAAFTKFVEVMLVTTGSREATPYPFVGPFENMGARILSAEKKKRGIYAISRSAK